MMLGLNTLQSALLEKLIAGIPADTIMAAAEDAAIDTRALRSILNPVQLARRIEARRYETSRDHAYWVLSLRRRLRNRARVVRCVDELDGSQFYPEFYERNRPVHVRTFFNSESLAGFITFDSLRAGHGDVLVKVTRGRSAPNEEVTVETIRLGDYIDEVCAQASGDHYLIAEGQAVLGPLGELVNKVAPPATMLGPTSRYNSSLWMGPAGAFTAFHYDVANVFIAQLLGKKRVYLVAPDNQPFMYEERGHVSRVDPRRPDAESFPLYRHAKVDEVVLNPGEALFVPVGWWHAVESTKPSFSVTLTNFHRTNEFPMSAI
jgi:hypothetical protein